MQAMVEKLCDKYQTRDPGDISRELGILVLYEELGRIRGYYNHAYGYQFIHINNALDYWQTRNTLAHELGHAVLHPELNTQILLHHTYISVDKLEREADKFSAYLLIDEPTLKECVGMSYTELSGIFHVSEELIRLRVEG